ncbi:hypothetical protein Daus18300_009892 [Diaporthe australafricana]|uniref:Uncharacterized protein n=1 Tax=Diaporthe australafricana TaxID=127596 RepID=A0ABR3WCB7_9PEZI
MPTAVRKYNRTRPADRPENESSSENIRTADSSVLQQQQQQPAHEVSESNNSNGLQDRSQGSGSPTDGARNPIAPGAEYTSLRKITRRLPDDPEHLLDGLDTTAADLSWTAREGDDINPKTGQPWLYPKQRGKKVGSNLEQFREEIEERTKNGQGCKAISEALVERGVDTSVRAVARHRMKWGLRQRAPRRMTEQGIANIRKAHLEQAKRMANSDPVPVKRVRIRVMRKAEIERMTKDGMSTAQIAENLQARGVKLKRGAVTVERLRTVWGLVPDSQRNANNIRQFCRNQASRLQKEQFENMAAELGIEDVKAWAKSKMDEDIAVEARREHGYKLMGHLRPKQLHADFPSRNNQYLRTLGAVDKTLEHGAATDDAETPDQATLSAQPGGAHDPIELSDDEAELDSEVDEDGVDDKNALAKYMVPQLSQLSSLPMELDHSESVHSQSVSVININDQSLQPLAAEVDHAFTNSQASQTDSARPHVHDLNTDPDFAHGFAHGELFPPYWAESSVQGQPDPGSVDQKPPVQPSPTQKQQQHQERSAEDYSAASLPSDPFQASSQGWLEPRSMGSLPPTSIPGSTTHRVIAPKPTPSQFHVPYSSFRPRPLAPRLPPVITPPGEAELMAEYGLYPVATPRRTPHKYLTPSGLVTTEGYEYLPRDPILPGFPDPTPEFLTGGGALPSQQQQTPPQAALRPQNCIQPRQPSNTQQVPHDIIMVPPPPPPLKTSRIPAPPLVIPPDEAEKHRASHGAVEKHHKAAHKAALECMEYLAARADARPLIDSLTGMPPSLKDVEGAKARLKEAAEAMLAGL